MKLQVSRIGIPIAITIAMAVAMEGLIPEPIKAGQIELVDSAFLAGIPGEKHDAGNELLGVKAKYPKFSWKEQKIRPGLPRDAYDIEITVLTPRGRATHAIVSALRKEGTVDPAEFKSALFNNGFLFAAIHEINPFRSKNPGWSNIAGVECRLADGQVVEPIATQLNPVNLTINGVPLRLIDLQALFPLWLLETDQELRFVISFETGSPYEVKYSAKKVKDLR